MTSGRKFQNRFENYKNGLSAIAVFKGPVITEDRRNSLHDYADAEELLNRQERDNE